MSRAHMLYDDKPLQQGPVNTTRWEGAFRQDGIGNSKGAGVLLEGRFMSRKKHVIAEPNGAKHRFVVLIVEFSRAHQRKFDEKGHEIEPNFGLSGKFNKGYLNSSYKVEAKGQHDILDYQEVCRRIQCQLTDTIKPGHAHCCAFWGLEGTYDHIEFDVGQELRLKTKGDSPFIDSVARLDSEQKRHASNYSGGDRAGQSWTDKVLGVKQSPGTGGLPPPPEQDSRQGVDEDEWDD